MLSQATAERWPNLESPETAAIWAADPLISGEQALEIGLAAETEKTQIAAP